MKTTVALNTGDSRDKTSRGIHLYLFIILFWDKEWVQQNFSLCGGKYFSHYVSIFCNNVMPYSPYHRPQKYSVVRTDSKIVIIQGS